MTEKRVTAGARATVTVEITDLGSWGPECTVEQIMKQAAEGAAGRVRQLIERGGDWLKDETPSRRGPARDVRIVGEPVVTGVFVTQDES